MQQIMKAIGVQCPSEAMPLTQCGQPGATTTNLAPGQLSYQLLRGCAKHVESEGGGGIGSER